MKIHVHLHDSTQEGEKWVTLAGGQHVLVDSKTGEVKGGAGGALNGKKYASAETVPFAMRGISRNSDGSYEDTPETDAACDALYAEMKGEVLSAINGMSHAERDACDFYFNAGYRTINASLRGRMDMDEKTAREVSLMASVIDRMPLKEDTVVHRGMNSDTVSMDDVKAGDTVTDKGFLSASLHPAFADGFSRRKTYRASFNITARKGTKALQGLNENEYEITFPPGTSLKITSAKKDPATGVMRFEAEII